jgi:hypothetical protein
MPKRPILGYRKYNLVEPRLSDAGYREARGAFRGNELERVKEAIVRHRAAGTEEPYFDVEPSDLPLARRRPHAGGKVRRQR